jgi:hypothetical protein
LTVKRYFRLQQLPGWSAQQYFAIAKACNLLSAPVLFCALGLLFQPFSEPISDWMMDYGWYAIVGVYIVIFVPQIFFERRRQKEIAVGYSTWVEEDKIENSLGQRIVLVDSKSGVILRIAGQGRLPPRTLSETRDERIAEVMPFAEIIHIELSSRGGSPNRQRTTENDSSRTLDEVFAEIRTIE